MNVKSLLLLLAFTGLGVSCNSDDENGPNGTGGRTELQIAFSGTGESVEYKTKATASESENKIDKLEVYLFVATAQNETYLFLEKWTDGTAYDPANPTETNFKKSETGTGWKASLYPNELKGYPFVKLMCVANNGVTAQSSNDGKFYAEDGTTETVGSTATPLVALDTDPDGTVNNAALATTEAAFRATFTTELGTDAATGIIATPLLMTGTGETKIAGSVSKVDITLRRIVARFDIENNVTKSNLTIQTVSLARGRVNGTLWGANRTVVAKDATSPLLTTYQPVDFTKIPGANTGITESALYTYPNLDTDESFLILKGTYKSPISSEQVPVTYNVPIVRTAEGAAQGTYIPVKANSRYHLKITDVTQSNVYGTFEVVDWTSGGGIIVKPDNDAPVFDMANGGFEGSANMPKKLANGTAPGDTCNYEVTGDVNGKGAFTIKIAATGAVRAEKQMLTTKAGEADWLLIGPATSKEENGVWYSTFEITYEKSIGEQPVAVTFINETASYDPALWTTLNFYGPKAVPGFAVVTDGNSKGNLTAVDGTTKAPSASLYNVKASYVTFDINSIEGVTVAEDTLGYTITKTKTANFTHTYKIAVKGDGTATDGKISFRNTGDETKKTELSVTKLDPSLKFTETAATGVTWVPGTETPFVTSGELKIDLDALTSYTFKIAAPKGLSVASLACPWLTITPGHVWEDTDNKRYAEYTITKTGSTPANTDDFSLAFTNALSEAGITAPGLTIKLHKDFGKPQFAAGTTTANWSEFNVGLASNFTNTSASTITMYKAIGSKITVKMTCGKEAASFEAATGLTVSQIGTTGEYEISIADQSALDAIIDDTTPLTAKNDEVGAGADRKATLTIMWKSSVATFSLKTDEDGQGGAVISSDDINVTYATVGKFSPITIDVKGYKGSTITYSGETTTWLKAAAPPLPTVIAADGTASISFLKDEVNQSASADIVITITNSIPNGGNKTITLKKL